MCVSRPLISILELCEALGIDEIEAKLLSMYRVKK